MDNNSRILLIGGLRIGRTSSGDYGFHGNLFRRLSSEVSNAGALTRYIAFDYLTEDNDPITFLGIEVDGIENIPDGMIAWDLDGHRLTILGKNSGKIGVIWQKRIEWLWLDKSQSTCNRGVTGEFSVRVPAEWTGTGVSAHRFFSLTANAYVAPGHTGHDDFVRLADYDPAWPQMFREFSDWLSECIGPDVALRIEHFGSTSIPGMIAKPIIDILVEVPSFQLARRRAIPLLNNELWEYWWYGNHMTFVKRDGLMGMRTHHVHMMQQGKELWSRLVFRDYLRLHAKDAARYAALKRQLSQDHKTDRERYTREKAAFVSEIVAKADKM